MTTAPKRIVSLLPSATEIVCALGAGDRLVGVTHECDWPPAVRAIPWITRSTIASDWATSREIDQAVKASLTQQSSIYHLDAELLDRLRPDLILTQELCAVCAVGTDEVREVLFGLTTRPDVLSLEPMTLAQVLESIFVVGRAIGLLPEAVELVNRLRTRIETVTQAIEGRRLRSVLSMEWSDPLFVGGHWVPDMIAIAGGFDVLGTSGTPSHEAKWSDVAAAKPDVAVVMLCGFDVDRSVREMNETKFPTDWDDLPAVRNREVWVTDGSAYFSRPGPRLIDGVEILTEILHPGALRTKLSHGFVRFLASGASSGRDATDGDRKQKQRAKSKDQRVAP